MVFASLGFVATARYFVVWAIILLALYAAFLLQADRSIVNKVYSFTNFTTFFTFACFVNWDIDRRARKTFAATLALEEERAKTEELLHNVLPEKVAKRLQRGETIADSYGDVSVIFVDIVGFSSLAKRLSPGHLVKTLNTVFGLADASAERFGVEKVKTVGDAYLAVVGGHSSSGRGAADAIHFAQDLIAAVAKFSGDSGIDVAIRIGIHTGNVVGGVVGSQRLAYDYWGNTMNIASRIEGVASPNGIAVSEATYLGAHDKALFTEPELMTLKGVGEMKVYRVVSED
nr:adenylate/guanylate cyclase domain-containing protein [Erythrobacter sp. F6033]